MKKLTRLPDTLVALLRHDAGLDHSPPQIGTMGVMIRAHVHARVLQLITTVPGRLVLAARRDFALTGSGLAALCNHGRI